jgi:hypothetical protein
VARAGYGTNCFEIVSVELGEEEEEEEEERMILVDSFGAGLMDGRRIDAMSGADITEIWVGGLN